MAQANFINLLKMAAKKSQIFEERVLKKIKKHVSFIDDSFKNVEDLLRSGFFLVSPTEIHNHNLQVLVEY